MYYDKVFDMFKGIPLQCVLFWPYFDFVLNANN